MAETPTDPQEYPYPTALPAPTPTIIQYSTTTQPINQTIVEEYVTVTGTGVTEDRVRQLITEANLWVDISKSLSLRPTSNSTSTSRIDTDLVTREYLLKSLDRVYDAVGDSGGDTTVVDVSADIAASLLASPSLFGASLAGTTTIGDGLALGTTTLQDLLTVDGAIYLAETSPLTTTNRLYNFGGELYWNGSVVTSSSTGNWSASGGDVFHLGGNVGIGTSSPTTKLDVWGNVLINGTAVDGYNANITLAPFATAESMNLSVNNVGDFSVFDNSSGNTPFTIFDGASDRVLTIADANVGIGTVIPTGKLTVDNSASASSYALELLSDTSGRGFNIGTSDYVYNTSGARLRMNFGSAGDTYALLDAQYRGISAADLILNSSGGNVGIGTTSPSSKLTVAGDALFTGSTTLPLIDAGGQVCDVRAYGAVGDNSTINDVAIAAAIAACPEGGTVYFPMGQFRISTPIVLDRPVTLRGAYSPRWSYSSSPRSSIRADFGTFAGVAMIHVRDRTISGQVNHNNGGRIEYLMLDGGSAGADVDGIYFEGLVRDWKLTDVDISQTTGNGFEAAVGTGSSNPRGFTIRGLSIYSADGHGFRATALNDSYIEDLLAVGNALRGIYISSMGETKISNSRAVFNALEGLYIDGASNNGGLTFTDFSTDRNDRHGVRISASGTTTIMFNGLLTRRDGANTGGGGETPYAGVAIIGSPVEKVAPVFITGLAQIVGLDDSQNPPLAPLTGVRVTNAEYVKIDGQLWGVNEAWSDDGGNDYFVIENDSVLKTGTAGDLELFADSSTWQATTTGLFYGAGNVSIGSTTGSRLFNITGASQVGSRYLDTTNNVTMDMRVEDFQGFIGTFSNHQLRFQTNNLSRLTIDTDGDIGIGTTSPSAKFAVYSTSAQDALSIRTNDGTVWGIDQFGGLNVSGGLRMKYITDGGPNTWGYSDLNDTYIASGDGGAQSNILLMPGSGGNLGIGTKSPNTFKLEVAGNVGPSADDTYNLGAAGRDWGCLYQSDGQTGTCASDARLKEDISTLTFDSTDASALEKLVALEMKSFAFKSAPDSQYHGLIAQEVLAVAPELVTERSDGFLAVKYGDIQWLIVEAVQQLWAMVTGNTERIEALEARIKALESELGASPVSSQPANATPEVDGGGGVNQFVPNYESEIEEDTASNTLNELPIERAPEVVEEVLMEGEEIDESLETTEDEDLPPSGVDETTELQLPNEDDSGFNDTPETEEEGTIPATLSNSNEADSNDSPETISSAETLTE